MIKYLKYTISRSPFKDDLNRKYDLLFFCSETTNIMKWGNAYFNRVAEYFAAIHQEKSIFIEDSDRKTYYMPKSFPNVFYHDIIDIEASIRSRFYRVNEKDVKTVKSIKRFLADFFPCAIKKSDLDILENSLLRLLKN